MKIFKNEIPVTSRKDLEEHIDASNGEVSARIKRWIPSYVEQGDDVAQAGVEEVVTKGTYFKGQNENGEPYIAFHPRGLRAEIEAKDSEPPYFLLREDELSVEGVSVVVMLRRERTPDEEALMQVGQPIAW